MNGPEGPATPGETPHHRANATLIMLARNSDVDGAVQSVRSMEDRFNHKYHYPWVFLNEQPFSDEFKRCAARFPLHLCPRILIALFARTKVASRSSSLGPCISDRSPLIIGISLSGSTRQRRRRRGKRWNRRTSYTVAVYRASLSTFRVPGIVLANDSCASSYRNMCRFNSGVRSTILSLARRPS